MLIQIRPNSAKQHPLCTRPSLLIKVGTHGHDCHITLENDMAETDAESRLNRRGAMLELVILIAAAFWPVTMLRSGRAVIGKRSISSDCSSAGRAAADRHIAADCRTATGLTSGSNLWPGIVVHALLDGPAMTPVFLGPPTG
jgi:hypothetical protein